MENAVKNNPCKDYKKLEYLQFDMIDFWVNKNSKDKIMRYTPRPRQQEAIDKIYEYITNSKKNHGLFTYPTSFGKSIVVAELASKFPNKYFINVTIGKELLKQNYEKYTSYGFEANLCSASLKENSVGKVTFATIGTIVKHVDFFKYKDVVILFDEAHEASATGSQLDKFLKQLKNYKLCGITATPFRLSNGMEGSSLKMMNRDRGCIYKSIEDVVQIQEVVQQGYWSKLKYKIIETDESSLVLNTTGSDFTDSSIEKYKQDNNLLEQVIHEVNELIKEGRKSILISVPSIQDALDLEAKIDNCKAIYSGMDAKDRDNIISAFKELKIRVIAQVKILTVGFDHPQLDGLVLAKPSNSLTFYYQFIGRLVRIHPLKQDGKVVCLSGNVKKFGKVEDITIENLEITKGWAVFSGETMLSNYPLNTLNRPTKQSLERKMINDAKKEQDSGIKFYFGKYKDKTVKEVMKENKSYLTWLLDQKDFNWYGEKGALLKKDIENKLGL